MKRSVRHESFSPIFKEKEIILLFLAIYLIGLLFYSYTPFTMTVGTTQLFRPDWLLSVPLLAYLFLWRRKIRLPSFLKYAVALLTATLISGAITGAVTSTTFLTVYLQLFYAFALVIAFSNLRIGGDWYRAVFRWWILLLSVAAFYAIVQTVSLNTGLPDFVFVDYSTNVYGYYGYNRPISFFSEPSYLSSALLSGLALLAPAVADGTPVFFGKRRQEVLAIVLAIGVVLAGSLSGYLTASVAVAVFFGVPVVRSLSARLVGLFVATLPVGLAGGAYLDVNLVQMIVVRGESIVALFMGQTTIGGGSVDIRAARWLAAFYSWLENPLFGTGPGLYETWIENADVTVSLTVDKTLTKIHGSWLQVLALTGVFGFAAFVGIFISIARDCVRIFHRHSPPEKTAILCGFTLVIVQLVGWSFNHSFITSFRWALIGLAYGYVVEQGGAFDE